MDTFLALLFVGLVGAAGYSWFQQRQRWSRLGAEEQARQTEIIAADKLVAAERRRMKQVTPAGEEPDSRVLDDARAARAKLGPRDPAAGPPPGKAWRRWAMVGALIVAIIGGSIDDTGSGSSQKQDDSIAEASTTTVATTETTSTTETTAGPDRAELRAEARDEVEDRDYGAALAAVAALGRSDRSYVRRLVGLHVARRAKSALSRGDRGAAKRALADASALGIASSPVAAARQNYQSAVDAARERREAAKAAREAEAARKAAAERAAEEAATEPESTDDSASYAGMTCPEIGHSFMVTPGSDPAHDRDGDGIACESQ